MIITLTVEPIHAQVKDEGILLAIVLNCPSPISPHSPDVHRIIFFRSF